MEEDTELVRHDVWRILHSRELYIASILGVLALGAGLYDYAKDIFVVTVDIPNYFNTHEAFLWSRQGIFGLIAPLLVTLPFAASFTDDRVSGFVRMSVTRSKRWEYLASKLGMNAVIGGLTLVIPHIVIFIVAAILLPEGLRPEGNWRITPTGPFSDIYATMPFMYCLFLLGLSFVFGMVYAVIGVFVSTLTDNRYIVLTTPFLFYFVGNFIIAHVGGIESWLPTVSLTPNLITTSALFPIVTSLSVLFVLSTIGTFIVGYKRLEAI